MPDIFTPELPVFADITAAVERLKGRTIRTPLLESPLLNQRMGRRILVKPECLQRTGSFKFRGASNKILALGDSVKTGGVVAYSSGNHAQGVAAAAHYAGIPALIVMPSDAPAIKRANTAAWGAEIQLYDRFTENREALAQSIAKSRGAAIVPPYDDPLVIAGQGTVGVEIAEQLDAIGVKPCAVVLPCGGGGLISGAALALSICDALLTPTPGVITFALNQALLSGGLSVTDAEAQAAMRTAFLDLKLVVEPGGAVALASILSGKLPPGDEPVVAVLSGGNVDPATFQAALEA